MSLRDEMAGMLMTDLGFDRAIKMADALMSLVERAAKEGARAGFVCSGRKPHDEWLESIVARVTARVSPGEQALADAIDAEILDQCRRGELT